MRWGTKPPVVKRLVKTSQFLDQALFAQNWLAAERERLVAEGWTWDGATQQYTHPDKPGSSIMIG